VIRSFDEVETESARVSIGELNYSLVCVLYEFIDIDSIIEFIEFVNYKARYL